MRARVLVTAGGGAVDSVLAGLAGIDVEVWIAAPAELAGATAGVPMWRRLPLPSLDDPKLGEAMLGHAHRFKADVVLPTGRRDLRAAAELAWVFDMRGTAVAAPPTWTLDACDDAEALARVWRRSASVAMLPGSNRAIESVWQAVTDPAGQVVWSGCVDGDPGAVVPAQVAAVVHDLDLRHASTLWFAPDDAWQATLVRVEPGFTAGDGVAVAPDAPRLVVEGLLGRTLERRASVPGAPVAEARSLAGF